jgi:myosin-crossreactive antigen
MVTTDNYECTWDLYKTIPSLNHAGQTVFDETVEFNRKHKANSMARLVDRRRAKVPVASMGFSIEDRIELLKLSRAGEDALAASRITDWLSPAFFETEFWYMWSTTFAFQPGTGGLVTFKDSNWPMSIVVACQPHFPNQAAGVQVFWGYSLFPDRVGNFVPKPMAECHGAEILRELCGHLRFDPETVESANCIPCRMPYITSMFMPRVRSDRPLPVPRGSKNFAFISQFVEIADDVVFTVEYSVRAAQMAVYELLGIGRKIPPVTPHAESVHAQFEALLKAFQRCWGRPEGDYVYVKTYEQRDPSGLPPQRDSNRG